MKTLKYYYWLTLYYFQLILKKDELNDARLWALLAHNKVKQTYDGYPYYFHLNKVENNVKKFSHLINYNKVANLAALFHDTIEDIHYLTFNNIKELWGLDVAEAVYACTELRGRNRKERHGSDYYELLKFNKIGRFVKICDVISNMERGIETGSSMLNKYRKEYAHFKEQLYTKEFAEMFNYIEQKLL